MNILTKIPFITIIFLVIVTQVLSEIDKRAIVNNNKCISLGGTCMNPNSCTGIVKNNLCTGGKTNKCCIPNQNNQTTNQNKKQTTTNQNKNKNNNKNKNKTTTVSGIGSKCSYQNIAGSCINTNVSKCGTSLVKNKCPGLPANVMCCLNKKINTQKKATNNTTQKKTTNNTTQKKTTNKTNKKASGVGSKCSYQNIAGSCINTNVSKCGTSLVKNKCPGLPANVMCCLNKKINTQKKATNNTTQKKTTNNTTQKKTTNKTNKKASGVGSKCSYQNIAGSCINTNVSKCGTSLVKNKCPGLPANVMCCLKKKINTQKKATNNTIQKKTTNNTTQKKTTNKTNKKASGVGSKCSYQNIAGSCINTNVSKCGTSLVKNKCPGLPANVMCCLNKKINTQKKTTNNTTQKKTTNKTNKKASGVGSKCSYQNIAGSCINTNVSKCGTSLVKNKCPGLPANVMCCLNKKINTQKKTTPQTTPQTNTQTQNKPQGNNSNAQNMKINQRGIELIKSFEQLRLESYCPKKDKSKCLEGDNYQEGYDHWTIGYGHTSGITKGMVITEEQANQYLMADIARAEGKVNKYQPKYNFNSNQFSALVSFAFNHGTIKDLTNDGTRSIEQIKEYMPKYRMSGGEVSDGLVRRRKEELDLFNS